MFITSINFMVFMTFISTAKNQIKIKFKRLVLQTGMIITDEDDNIIGEESLNIPIMSPWKSVISKIY